MDVLTHMTGGSGFSQQYTNWQYSRNESHIQPEEYATLYTHLVTEAPNFHSEYFEVFEEVHGLVGVRIKSPSRYLADLRSALIQSTATAEKSPLLRILPISINTSPLLYLMQRKLSSALQHDKRS